jgi:hypothetical protein
MDFVTQARDFAVTAHKSIDHRRKYTSQPYAVHLEHVVTLVKSVTDDPETLAAAWLHDVVEDTAATLEDVEDAFGRDVARLVDALTDVSKPGDGNRAVRKALDRHHLAAAPSKAQIVKLADLIDNARDITAHDPSFAAVYLEEMADLLEVLHDGDPRLLALATETRDECCTRLSAAPAPSYDEAGARMGLWGQDTVGPRLTRLFMHTFAARDIAEPLRSFDVDAPCDTVLAVMERAALDVVCLRESGSICGYVRRADLTNGRCGDHLRTFRHGQVVPSDAPLSEVIHGLTLQGHAFVSMLGEICGYISRSNINKPVARMWLFGMVTLAEMEFMRMIDEYFPDDSWQTRVPPERLAKASAFHAERVRRNQPCRLLECLQFSDKFQVLMEHPEAMARFRLESKRTGKRLAKELESLRNNLAHAQDITQQDWASIVRIAARLEQTALSQPKPPREQP